MNFTRFGVGHSEASRPPLSLPGDDSLPPSEFEAGFQPRVGPRVTCERLNVHQQGAWPVGQRLRGTSHCTKRLHSGSIAIDASRPENTDNRALVFLARPNRTNAHPVRKGERRLFSPSHHDHCCHDRVKRGGESYTQGQNGERVRRRARSRGQ